MGRFATIFVFIAILVFPCTAFPQSKAVAWSSSELEVQQKVLRLQELAANERSAGRNLNAFNHYLSAMKLLPSAAVCSPGFLEFSFAVEMNVIGFVDTLLMEFRNSGSRITLSRFVFPVYEHAISIAYRMYAVNGKKEYFNQAFILAEKSKNLRVVEALRNSGATAMAGVPKWLSDKFNRLSADLEKCQLRYAHLKSSAADAAYLKKMNDTLALLQQRNDSLSCYIYNKFPAYLGLMNRRDFMAADNVRKQLIGDSSALMEYFCGDTTIYLFIITDKQEAIIRTSRKDCPDSLLLSFQQSVIGHDFMKFRKFSSRIYDLLFMPAEHILTGISRVIVIPDGLLSYVPFGCLTRTKETKKTDYKSLDYLVRYFSFSYSPSATALIMNMYRSESRSDPSFHFLAPLYNENLKAKSRKIQAAQNDSVYLQLSEQRWSGELAGELKKMFRGSFYLGESANIGAFRKSFSEPGIIHIAAHTLFNDDDAMNSRIVFAKEVAGDTLKQDAYLYAYDLVGTNAKSSLVVLASCRTGFGTFRRCDGISGISMGFSYAGCPSLIFTLWEVDEKATNQLMLNFYTALQSGASIDRSLQQAQLTHLETANEIGADPYYWAGLLASGDCRPFTFETERRALPKALVFGSAILFIAISFSIFVIFRRRQGKKSKRFV